MRISDRRGIWQRHKGKLIFSSAIVATLFTTGAVALIVIKKWLYRQQLKITEQHFVKEQIKRRFTQTQQDALYTIYELVPVLSLVLAKDLNVDETVALLKGKKLSRKLSRGGMSVGDGEQNDGLSSGMSTSVTEPASGVSTSNHDDVSSSKTKADLWNELKLKSLVKLFTVVYSISSLLLLTRLQLNILARREYLETAIKVAVKKEAAGKSSVTSWISSFWKQQDTDSEDKQIEEQLDGLDQQSRKTSYINEQAFLSLSWWMLNRGWLQFRSLAEKHVELEFGALSPRDTLSLEDFGEKVSHIFHAINQELLTQPESEPQPLPSILLPEPNLEQFVLQQTLDSDALKLLYEDNTILRQLMNETSKCVQSTASLIVLESLVNDAYQFFMTQIEEKIAMKSKKQADTETQSNSKYQVALFSVSCKDCCDEMLKSGVVSMNNLFLQRLDSIPELDDLSASVYSNFGF